MRENKGMTNKRLKLLGMLLGVLALGSLVVAACARPGTTTAGGTTPTASGGPSGCASGTVQTNATNFVQPCVTIAKGAKVTIVPVVVSLHILTNGSWVNGTAHSAQEPGAPTISNVQVTNANIEIGPFSTAGTFHLYCTVHVGMNLTVNVT